MNKNFMEMAIDVALQGMDAGKGGPFGAIVVKNGEVIASGCNEVTSTNDPTAHAEVVVIRKACQVLDDFQLKGCELYTTCEPCPMCLGAIYWARPDIVYFGSFKEDAAFIGFDDEFIYDEIDLDFDKRKIKFLQLDREKTISLFKRWEEMEGKREY